MSTSSVLHPPNIDSAQYLVRNAVENGRMNGLSLGYVQQVIRNEARDYGLTTEQVDALTEWAVKVFRHRYRSGPPPTRSVTFIEKSRGVPHIPDADNSSHAADCQCELCR
jgi:hypothetical protein